jgi:periplasmic copper chaperone A
MKNQRFLATACVLMASTTTAWPHVVLDQSSATAGSSYRAVFRVGHGCDGLATTGITVHMPVGVQGARPMPKPGWMLDVRKEALTAPYTSHGKRIASDVSEITWTATSKESALHDAHYGEFVLRATLPAKPGVLWFKVVQICDDNGTEVRREWAQQPKEGSDTNGLSQPAVRLQVEPAAQGHSHH